MANDSNTQQALAIAPNFLRRLQAVLTQQAWVVLGEGTGVLNHTQRKAYANQVLSNPAGFAVTMSPSFVMRTNVFAAATSYDFSMQEAVSAVSDASIQSQLATDWDTLSGV